ANGLKSSFTAPDGTVYEYRYGDNNELREITIPGVGAITIAEYQWSRPTSVIYPGGGRRELEYDGLMRLKNLSATDPGGNSLLDYSYSYDNSGNIVNKNTEHGEYVYGYDSASRLTSADNPTLDDESDSYDAVGNRTSASNANGEIVHNKNNELERYGDMEFLYDDNGNIIQKKLGNVAVNYIYNAANRLIRVEDELTGTVIAEYYYDPFGRRLWKDANQTRTYFFYSDEGLVAEYGRIKPRARFYWEERYRQGMCWRVLFEECLLTRFSEEFTSYTR
ncbi:MAG: RHS repeat protein, partial [bacterium]|nr:RHS repeat protein [bacterium]